MTRLVTCNSATSASDQWPDGRFWASARICSAHSGCSDKQWKVQVNALAVVSCPAMTIVMTSSSISVSFNPTPESESFAESSISNKSWDSRSAVLRSAIMAATMSLSRLMACLPWTARWIFARFRGFQIWAFSSGNLL